jgi:beta-carotene 3-hydroxylase
MTAVAIALIALVVMEPVTALLHRRVFHGFAMGWHRSHHEPPHGSFEANDLFPLVFATATILVMSIGVWVGGGSVLVPLGVGITAYGATYLVVHDVVIHRRLPWLPIPDRVGARARAAHNVHHLYSGAPFGFLAPVVPRDLAARADARGVDRTRRPMRFRSATASGSADETRTDAS